MVPLGRGDGRAAMSRTQVLCIVGPTASGKSLVAEEVALAIGGEVVSVDSMQVYEDMDIGTAKVPARERRCALHMVDVATVSQPYSVAEFQRDARACVDALAAQGRVPVLCGGTGLYLDAVIDDMRFPRGELGSEGRARYERIAEEQGPSALHALLKSRDPRSAEEIHPNNVRRVVRALEMLDGGTSYASHHEGLLRRSPHYDATIWSLVLPREELYARINERVDAMFEQGLVDEVARLDACGLRGCATAAKAIGYKEVLDALDGTISLDEARELVKRNTRRFAKRQLSWLRRDGRARQVELGETGIAGAVELICDEWKAARP